MIVVAIQHGTGFINGGIAFNDTQLQALLKVDAPVDCIHRVARTAATASRITLSFSPFTSLKAHEHFP